MKTSEKREYIIKKYPALLEAIQDQIENQEFRQLDTACQIIDDNKILQYIITLLCDELIQLTNENLEV